MGSASERMIEIQQEQADRRLAESLGITYDELLELDHEIDTEESNDGLIYNYIIRFKEDAPREILDKVHGIDENDYVWLPPWEMEEMEYYQEQYDAITGNKDFLNKFQEEITNLENLNNLAVDDPALGVVLKRQIFSGVIGTLETFLSDTFINRTMDDDEYFKNFIESYPEFKQRKFELRHLFVEQGRIKATAKKIMLDVIYHDLPKISKMYASTFKIEFPNIGPLMKDILTRHDLVHRNGKTKDGEEVVINEQSIIDLIKKVRDFVQDISGKLNL